MADPLESHLKLIDHRHDDKILWKNDEDRFVENYQVNLEATDPFDQESRAIREIAQRFAQSLVASLLEGF